jgi:aminopeptidase N/puromycin-sensitive aminopeptidase
MMDRPWAASETWAHVKSNWEGLQRTGVFQGVRSIVRSTDSFCDTSSRDDVEQFFKTHKIEANDRVARQALETIDRCIATRSGQAANLESWLKAQGSRP